MRPDGAPDDYDADVPDDYYERKMRHREEMLPVLTWVFIAGLVCVALALLFSARSDAQEIPAPLSTPCSGGEYYRDTTCKQ